jgi:YD repeat-containing protein
MRTVDAQGKWVRATRDQAGRITSLTRSNGKSRTYTYNAIGAVTDYVDAKGRHTVFQYSRTGRLTNSSLVSKTTQDHNRYSIGGFRGNQPRAAMLKVSYNPITASRGAGFLVPCADDAFGHAGAFQITDAVTADDACGDDDGGGDDDDDDDDDDDNDDDFDSNPFPLPAPRRPAKKKAARKKK